MGRSWSSSGKPGDARHGAQQKLARMAFALFLPSLLPPPCLPLLISPLFPPHIFIGSGNSVDLHVRQSLATHTERKPSPGGVAVSALAVVRQCKIKLIKPPTQENITGN